MDPLLARYERQATLMRPPHLDEIERLAGLERLTWRERQAELAVRGDPVASFLTGTNTELIYASTAAGTAKNTFTAEVAINDTAGMGVQAHLPPDFWQPFTGDKGRGIYIYGSGIVSSTVTPSYTWTVRGGAAGATTGAIMAGTAALATASGIANIPWYFHAFIVAETIGAAGANSTLRGTGYLLAPGYAAAAPTAHAYAVWGGAASPGTVATFDTSITNYINFNITCTASSASNTITLHQLLVFGLN